MSSLDLINVAPAQVRRQSVLFASPAADRAGAPGGWLHLFPPRFVEWNRLELSMPRLPAGMAGLRIVHLTDIHLRRRWPAALSTLHARLRDDPPDLLLFTGDFVDNKRNHRPAMPCVRRFVSGLTARFGCFAIHGNHDSYQVGAELADLPLTFLDGRRQLVQTPLGQVELIGAPGRRRSELTVDFVQSLPPHPPGALRIVLSHFPDNLPRMSALEADLFLAGHTHGGQVCLPGGTPILRHDHLPRRLVTGAHKVGPTWLVVGRGLGWTGLPVRAFCSPEAIEIICQS